MVLFGSIGRSIRLFLFSFFCSSLFSFLMISVYGLSSHAMVDMKNANYAETWTDLEVPGSGYTMRINRTYNSRTLFNGIFGFGWCSDYETSLEVTAEGNLRVTECGAGSSMTYSPRELTSAEKSKTADSIIAKMKEEKVPGRKEDFYKETREKVLSDENYRDELAKKYGVSIPPREGLKYLANGKELEHITFQKTHYTRNFADGSSQRFDTDGKITHFYDKNGNYLKFEYEKGLLTTVIDNNARKLSLKYYANKKIKEILGPNGLKSTYVFKNVDDLTSVTNSWKNTYTYEYDDLHNLTKTTWPDKTTLVLKYDQKRDWVLSVTDRKKCTETYTYEDSKDDPLHHYWSVVKKVCGKKEVANNRYEFWHKKASSGEYYLHKVKQEVKGEVSEYTYHEFFGKPVVIEKNNVRTAFDYFPDGLLKVKAQDKVKQSFSYEQGSKKIGKVVTEIMDDKQKVQSTKWSAFKYDPKGNLINGENSDGQKVVLTYDAKGRISTITDQAKKVVKLEWDEKFMKPSVITRPGLGKLKINYKSNGEIGKVESKEGPSVASQIAATFNNLLDVIAPATSEMYL